MTPFWQEMTYFRLEMTFFLLEMVPYYRRWLLWMDKTLLSAGRDESPFDRKWSYLKQLQMTSTVFLTKNDTFTTGSDTLSDQKWHPFQLEITPFLTGSDCAVVTAQAPSCRKQPRTYWSELSNTKYFSANKALFFIETHKVLAFSRNNLIHI